MSTVFSRWKVWLPAIAVGLLLVGMIANTTTSIYDVAHPAAVPYVSPEEAANRNGLADLGIDVVGELIIVLSAIFIFGHLVAIPGLVLGQPWAHVTACVMAAPIALCCGVLYVDNGGSFPSAAYNPDSIPRHVHAPNWVHVNDALGPPLLVGAAIAVLIVLFLPPVYRRFHGPFVD